MINNAFGKGAFKEYGHLQTVEEIDHYLDTK